MGRKIIGATVGTPLNPKKVGEIISPVKSVNGKKPDETGNVDIAVSAGASVETIGLYATLHDALAQTNKLSDGENAAMRAFYGDDGRLRLMLLKDLSVDTVINIDKDVEIVLAGHTMTMTNADARLVFGLGTNCIINGEAKGSTIAKQDIQSDKRAILLESNGEKLTINGGRYTLGGNMYEARALLATGAQDVYSSVEIDGAEFILENGRTEKSTTYQNIVIQTNVQNTVVRNSSVSGESKWGNTVGLRIRGSENTGEVSYCKFHAYCQEETSFACVIEGKDVAMHHLYTEAWGNENIVWAVHVSGSANIFESEINAECNSEARALSITPSGRVNLCNSTITALSFQQKADGIVNEGPLDIKNCNITATAKNDGTLCNARGVKNYSTLNIADSVVIGDAPGDNADEEHSYGIYNGGYANIKNCEVFGTLAGISNHNVLYVSGGTLTGYSHGGIYVAHGENGALYARDCLIRCGHYVGIHTDLFDESVPRTESTTDPYGSMYVGGGSGDNSSDIKTAYFDGCTFGDEEERYKYESPIVMRGTSGEVNNSIQLSNCQVKNNGVIRVDDASVSVYSGVGNTTRTQVLKDGVYVWEVVDGVVLTREEDRDFAVSDCLHETNELYRKIAPMDSANDADFDALKKRTVNIPQGGGKKQWRLLDFIDFSLPENQTHIEFTDLGGVTEIYMEIDGCQNATAMASGSNLYVNGVQIAQAFAPNRGKEAANPIQYWWAYAYYNGLVWVPMRSLGTTSKTNITMASAVAPYTLFDNVGEADTIKLTYSSQYGNIEGTWKIWVR